MTPSGNQQPLPKTPESLGPPGFSLSWQQRRNPTDTNFSVSNQSPISGQPLRTYDGLMNGTKHGPVLVPRSAFTSNLIAVIDGRTDPSIWMPHKKKRMTKCERLIFRFWVNQGANDN